MIDNADEFLQLREVTEYKEFRLLAATEDTWLEILSRFPEHWLLISANKTLPQQVLDKLSRSEDVDVRWEVATKRKLSHSLFERLAHDEDPSVRHRIACNPKVPREILEILTLDRDEMVSESAIKKMKMLFK